MAAKPTAILTMAIRWITAEKPAAAEVIRFDIKREKFKLLRLALKDRELRRNSMYDVHANIHLAELQQSSIIRCCSSNQTNF